LYLLMSRDESFPTPIKLGASPKSQRWRAAELFAWIDAQRFTSRAA